MPAVAAFLVPGSPLPRVRPDNPPWGALAAAMTGAGERLARSSADVILMYSTQWIAVLDQLWQTRPRLHGRHVDENWHEYGALDFDITTDVELALACVDALTDAGVRSRAVDYDGFPVDTGAIVAAHFLNPGRMPMVMTSNNLYHDGALTETIAATAMQVAEAQGKQVAVVGVGGLSGSFFRHDIDIAADRIADASEDEWNRRVLDLIAAGDVEGLRAVWADYAREARADMGLKHLNFILGALGGGYRSAEVLGYGPIYGSGAAVISFTP